MPYFVHPLTGVGFLRAHINQICIMAQSSECCIPSLPHATEGQRGAFTGAMHAPFQRALPSLPCHSVHGTSWYLPSIASRPLGKKAPAAPESSHRSKLRLALFSAYRSHNEKGKNSLHGHVELVERVGDRLAAPYFVSCYRAQIANPYNNGVPHRTSVAWCIWVTGWGYLEAAPASVTITAGGTECKLIDRSRIPGCHAYAARCRRTSR